MFARAFSVFKNTSPQPYTNINGKYQSKTLTGHQKEHMTNNLRDTVLHRRLSSTSVNKVTLLKIDARPDLREFWSKTSEDPAWRNFLLEKPPAGSLYSMVVFRDSTGVPIAIFQLQVTKVGQGVFKAQWRRVSWHKPNQGNRNGKNGPNDRILPKTPAPLDSPSSYSAGSGHPLSSERRHLPVVKATPPESV